MDGEDGELVTPRGGVQALGEEMLGMGTPGGPGGFLVSTPSPMGMRMGMALGMRMGKAFMAYSGAAHEGVGAGGELDLLGEGMLDTPSPLVRRRPTGKRRQRVMAAGGTPPALLPESAEHPPAAKRGNFQGVVAPLDLSGIVPLLGRVAGPAGGLAVPPSPVPKEKGGASPGDDDRSGYASTARTEGGASSVAETPLKLSVLRTLEAFNSPGSPQLRPSRSAAAPAAAAPEPAKMFVCEKCPVKREFASKGALETHVIEAHGLLFGCKMCGKSFEYQHVMQRHMEKKHPKGGAEASETGTPGSGSTSMAPPIAGGNLAHLPAHLPVHLPVHLPAHLPAHLQKQVRQPAAQHWAHGAARELSPEEEARTHVCDVCGARFKKGNGLRKHRAAVHSSEADRVQCDQCNTQFKNKIYLRKHVRETHEAAERGRLDCAWCGLRSSSIGTAREHLKKCYIAHVVRAFEAGGGAADLGAGVPPMDSGGAWAAAGGQGTPRTPVRSVMNWIPTVEGMEAIMNAVTRTPDRGAALLQLATSPLPSALNTPQGIHRTRNY